VSTDGLDPNSQVSKDGNVEVGDDVDSDLSTDVDGQGDDGADESLNLAKDICDVDVNDHFEADVQNFANNSEDLSQDVGNDCDAYDATAGPAPLVLVLASIAGENVNDNVEGDNDICKQTANFVIGLGINDSRNIKIDAVNSVMALVEMVTETTVISGEHTTSVSST